MDGEEVREGRGDVAPTWTCSTTPGALRSEIEVRNISTHLLGPFQSIRELCIISRKEKKAKLEGGRMGHMPFCCPGPTHGPNGTKISRNEVYG